MKTLFMTILILNCFLYPLFGQQTLNVTASLSKTTYLVGEPVDLLVEYRNAGSVTIKKGNTSVAGVEIMNEKKEIIYDKGFPCNYSAEDRDYLPGESTFRFVDLCETYGKGLYYKHAPGYFDAGNYTVIIKHGLPGGKLKQTYLRFRVVNPKGDELLVFNSAKSIMSGDRADEQTEGLIKLYEKYPNSVYSPIILEMIESYYGFRINDLDKYYKYIGELIDRYPWSSHARSCIPNALKGKKSKEERVALLKKIITNSKGHSIEKMYEKQLQKALQE